jgi:hypothetical protein
LRPQVCLYVGVGGIFVFVLGGVQIGVHGCFSGMGEACAYRSGLSSVTSPFDRSGRFEIIGGEWFCAKESYYEGPLACPAV